MYARDDDMSTASDDEKSLREKIEHAERTLEGLLRELQGADGDLTRLREKQPQYELLKNICVSLEELDDLGAEQLFWGSRNDAYGEPEQLVAARRNLDSYANEIGEAEDRRQTIVDKIDTQHEVLDFLDSDLRDAMERAEARQSEWAVEREAHPVEYRAQIMPWARGCEEDRFSRRAVAAALLVSLLLGLLLPMIDLPIPERAQLTEVPERVAKLIREVRTPPPPPPVEEAKPPEQEPEKVVEEKPPEEIPESVEVPAAAEAAQENVKEQVKSKGILAFRDSFANRAKSAPTARLGSQATVRSGGQDAVGRPERSMVTTSAPGSSGGINLGDISRDVGGGGQAMEGVALARVATSIGGGEGPDRPLSGGPSAGRTDEEIQIVFDRYKAALYRLYNRELRKDPTLRGQLVLRLTIEPDGSVSFCQLQSSDMDAPTLAEQVVDRVRTFDFGAKDGIVAMTIIYPIDFLPAA